MRQLKITQNSWPVAGSFRISRSSLTAIDVVTVEITDGIYRGRGECRPYARYDETPECVMTEIESHRAAIESGLAVDALQTAMPAGAARNAIDCALWDLEAKQNGRPVWDMLDLPEPKVRTTAFTLSIDTPKKMAEAAIAANAYPVLKLKIGGMDGLNACQAVIAARPDAELIIDANEALSPEDLVKFCSALSKANIVFIEQPLPDAVMDAIDPDQNWQPPLCADESLHTKDNLERIWKAGYRAVNVKLDKTGGLTEAVTLMRAAKERGFAVMAGCMVGTSLAMAPMMMLESFADYIDLDGPLLLAKDVEHGLRFDGAHIHPPKAALWG